VLTHQSIVIIVCLIRANLGTDEFCLNEMSCDDLQRLTVLFVHSQKEQREHDDNHAECCQTDIAGAFHQKEKRHPNECRRTEADQLAFSQIEEHLGFHPRQVTGYGDICCQTETSFPLVGTEHALSQSTCLKQREAQKNRVAHDSPNGTNDVAAERNRLNQHRIDADTDDDKEPLESNGKQRTQIVLTDIALFSVTKSGERNRRKAYHQ